MREAPRNTYDMVAAASTVAAPGAMAGSYLGGKEDLHQAAAKEHLHHLLHDGQQPAMVHTHPLAQHTSHAQHLGSRVARASRCVCCVCGGGGGQPAQRTAGELWQGVGK